MSNPYNYFDSIVCITLDGAIERQEHVRKVAKELNIPFEFYYAKRSTRSGLVGCFESHINVIENVYNKGKKNVLIFEDDFIPAPKYSPDIIKSVTNYMNSNTDWEMIKLGYLYFSKNTNISDILLDPIFYITSQKVDKHLIKWIGVATHSYCVSRKGMKKLITKGREELKRPDNEVHHYDLFLHFMLDKKNCFCVVPNQFNQKLCFPTQNSISEVYGPIFQIFEKLYRNNQCQFEKLQIFDYLNAMREYRWRIIIVFIILTILLLSLLFIRQ